MGLNGQELALKVPTLLAECQVLIRNTSLPKRVQHIYRPSQIIDAPTGKPDTLIDELPLVLLTYEASDKA